VHDGLAEGHIQSLPRTGVNMAFGQTIEFVFVSWGGAVLAPGYGENGLRPIFGRETRNIQTCDSG
jgi:hypothetical protein